MEVKHEADNWSRRSVIKLAVVKAFVDANSRAPEEDANSMLN